MKLLSKAFFTLTAATTLLSTTVEAKYVVRDGSMVNQEFAPTMSYLDHYSAGCKSFIAGDFKEAHRHFYIVSNTFNNCPLATDAYFYLAICYFDLEEYDIANSTFDSYLASTNNPRFFELAFQYKFAIAEKFRCGSRRRFCGTQRLPKWACGRELAVTIYNEVINSLPSHELSVRSLYSKGWLLWEDRDFKGAVESFQMIVRRFPRNELTPECYILVNHIYLNQAEYEYQNPDLLALAEINTQRFIRAFPKEERICQAEDLVQWIKEVYAKGMYDIAIFYERTSKPRAAIIYYQNTIARFPDTAVAQAAVERIQWLRPDCCETLIPRNFYESNSPSEEAVLNTGSGEDRREVESAPDEAMKSPMENIREVDGMPDEAFQDIDFN